MRGTGVCPHIHRVYAHICAARVYAHTRPAPRVSPAGDSHAAGASAIAEHSRATRVSGYTTQWIHLPPSLHRWSILLSFFHLSLLRPTRVRMCVGGRRLRALLPPSLPQSTPAVRTGRVPLRSTHARPSQTPAASESPAGDTRGPSSTSSASSAVVSTPKPSKP
jgi:hypothetical protein